jgi:hypothetical protein
MMKLLPSDLANPNVTGEILSTSFKRLPTMMTFSFSRLNKMKLTVARLAHGFGNLATIRGTTKYHISPFEQRAFAGMITKGIPNTLWRIRCSVLDVAPRKLSAVI